MHLLITAGPTREALDPVRFLSNRSSGKMGYALAAAAVARGHRVTLISGPVALDVPPGVDVVSVVSAEEMYLAVETVLCGSARVDAAILSAAVADYRPVVVAGQKIKKSEGRLVLELERTRDILGSMRSVFGYEGRLVGFAAETEKILDHAWDKLRRKGCDFLVANDVSRPEQGFDVDVNEVVILEREGGLTAVPLGSKREVAERILDVVLKAD